MTTHHPTSTTTRVAVVAIATVGALATLLTLSMPIERAAADTVSAQSAPLEQIISSEQPIADDDKVLSSGHIDIGPLFDDDGNWRLMIHDDSAEPSQWRRPENTAIWVQDTALVELPDDPTYSFLGAEPGDEVHVVGQTQNPDVVWIGWNTQAPTVRERIDRGVTLSLSSVEGPGSLSVYLQAGNFTEPDVLWQSSNLADADDQSIWIDVNSHTHANWVFSEPGLYFVEVEVTATLIDATEVSTIETLRFAVGDAADPHEAIATVVDHQQPTTDGLVDTTSPDGADDESTNESSSSAVPLAMTIAGLAAATLIASVIVRSRRPPASEARSSKEHHDRP